MAAITPHTRSSSCGTGVTVESTARGTTSLGSGAAFVNWFLTGAARAATAIIPVLLHLWSPDAHPAPLWTWAGTDRAPDRAAASGLLRCPAGPCPRR